jgi:hypothetical protein
MRFSGAQPGEQTGSGAHLLVVCGSQDALPRARLPDGAGEPLSQVSGRMVED